jgi:TRAP-type C4-dicarboxylate transport system permease small subunit
LKRLTSVVSIVAAASLFAMMLLTFADVIGRKLLGNSIVGAVELTELCMLVMIFMALPLASLAGEHIVFDLLDRYLPARVLHLQMALAHAVSAVIFGGAAWLVWVRSVRTYSMGDVTARLEIGLGPFHQMVAAMLLITALVHVALIVREWRHRADPAQVTFGGHAPPRGDA